MTPIGYINPAIEALAYMKHFCILEDIDIDSFYNVSQRSDLIPELEVNTNIDISSLIELCEKGDFVIFHNYETKLFQCMNSDEFKKSKHWSGHTYAMR